MIQDRLTMPARAFTNIEKSLMVDISSAGQRIVAVGERGGILYSEDGRHWSQAKVPVSTLLTAVFMVDDEYGWAVGHGGVVLKTSDGGQTWQKQFDGTTANQLLYEGVNARFLDMKQQFEIADEDDKEDLEYELEETEYALSDAKSDQELGPTKPLLDVWFKNRDEGYVLGAYGFFFKTTDGGETWVSHVDRLENLERYHLNAMTKLRDGTLIIVGEAGVIFTSYDDGDSWEAVYGPYQGSYFGLQSTSEESAVLAYGLRGHVFKSSDGGQSWDRAEVPVKTSLTASGVDLEGNIWLVGHSGVVLVSEDNGLTFKNKGEGRFDAHNAIVFTRRNELLLAGEYGIRLIQD